MTDESLPLPCYVLLGAIDEAGHGGILVDRFRADSRYSQDAERLCRAKKLIRVGSYMATGSHANPYVLTFRPPELDVAILTPEGEAALMDWRLQSKKETTAPRKRKRGTIKVKPLTARQVEVVQIVGECNGDLAEAARKLGIDRKTVKQHFDAASRKLGKAVVTHATQPLRRGLRGEADVSYEDDRRGI
jgi:predicted DNA-binding protein (UPF0251 family)